MENQNESQDVTQAESENNPLYNQSVETQPSAEPIVQYAVPEATVQPVEQNASPVIPQVQIKYAGFWIRWAASFIDGLVLFIPQLILSGIISVAGVGVMQKLLTNVASFLLTWTYYIYMTNKYQATLGKKALGIRVFSTKPEGLTFGQVVLRETIGKLISIFTIGIGYIMVGLTEKKQGLHDMLASTVVVHDDPNKKTPVWVFIVAAIIPIIAILGILASVVLVSLSSARDKAQDMGIRSSMSSVVTAALAYKNTNGTYRGFKIDSVQVPCSGQPVINISPDGRQIAVFMKSCKDTTKYFCANPETNFVAETATISDSYMRSGATTCGSSDIVK